MLIKTVKMQMILINQLMITKTILIKFKLIGTMLIQNMIGLKELIQAKLCLKSRVTHGQQTICFQINSKWAN